MDELIKERQLYKHYKGGLYRVVSVFVSEPDGIRMVMYQQAQRPFKIYARPYAEFIVKFDEMKMEKTVKQELFDRLEREVSIVWTRKISPEQTDIFLTWALEGQVYSMPGNEVYLGDAFRGFVTGCNAGLQNE